MLDLFLSLFEVFLPHKCRKVESQVTQLMQLSFWILCVDTWVFRIKLTPFSKLRYILYLLNLTFSYFLLLFLFCLKPLVPTSDGSNTIFSNIEQTQTSLFEHQMDMNMFIWKQSNSELTSNGLRMFYPIRKCTFSKVSGTFSTFYFKNWFLTSWRNFDR